MPEIEKSLELQADHFIDEMHRGNTENVANHKLFSAALKALLNENLFNEFVE